MVDTVYNNPTQAGNKMYKTMQYDIPTDAPWYGKLVYGIIANTIIRMAEAATNEAYNHD